VTCNYIPEERIFKPTHREKFKTRTNVLDRKREENRTFDNPGSEGEDGIEIDVTGTELEDLGRFL
jgi:hypothetical protein